jgi:hypothetical protein
MSWSKRSGPRPRHGPPRAAALQGFAHGHDVEFRFAARGCKPKPAELTQSVSIILLLQIGETGIVQANRGEHFLRMAFSARWNLGLASPSGPRDMQRRHLTKPCLVFENDHRSFVFGVFLD